MHFETLTLPLVVVMAGIYWTAVAVLHHKEKISDAIRENQELKKEIAELKKGATK